MVLGTRAVVQEEVVIIMPLLDLLYMREDEVRGGGVLKLSYWRCC